MSGKRTVIRRADANQSEVMGDLRKYPGISVRSLHTLGDGIPDLIVGFRGSNYLFELKDPEKPPSKRKLTEDEIKFFDSWNGQVEKVETVKDILEAIGYDHK